MQGRIRAFFAAHRKATTALHVTLAVLPAALLAAMLLSFLYLLIAEYEAEGLALLIGALMGYGLFFGVGVFSWILSLYLYRFTHAVREKWPEWLRMMLIRFNIVGGLMAVGQAIIWIVVLMKE